METPCALQKNYFFVGKENKSRENKKVVPHNNSTTYD